MNMVLLRNAAFNESIVILGAYFQ